jgi:hypothetical protein
MTTGDSYWAAGLMERRRERYAEYSPVFWRPASRMRSRHAAFLAQQFANPLDVALRTDRSFVVGQRRGDEMFVDDFAVESDGLWATDGAALLSYAFEELAVRGARAVRVVTAGADLPKVELMRQLQLELVEQWWVRPVETDATPALGPVEADGVRGVVTMAPPVYDPGGPVFLSDPLSDNADPTGLVDIAADRGCVLAVAPTPAGAETEYALLTGGWAIASQWYTGVPRVQGLS